MSKKYPVNRMLDIIRERIRLVDTLRDYYSEEMVDKIESHLSWLEAMLFDSKVCKDKGLYDEMIDQAWDEEIENFDTRDKFVDYVLKNFKIKRHQIKREKDKKIYRLLNQKGFELDSDGKIIREVKIKEKEREANAMVG